MTLARTVYAGDDWRSIEPLIAKVARKFLAPPNDLRLGKP